MGIREQLGAPKTGDFLGIVKWDALARAFWRVDKDQLGQPVLTDLLGKPIAFDFGTTEFGWMKFGPQGPVRHMTPLNTTPPPRPDEVGPDGKLTFKAGFYTKVCGQALDGVREWCSTTSILIDAFDLLAAQYEAAPEAWRGQIPLIVITGAVPHVKGGGVRKQTTYLPIIQITGWVERPAALGERTTPLPKPPADGVAAKPPVPPVGDRTVPLAQRQQTDAVPRAAPASAASLPVDAMPF